MKKDVKYTSFLGNCCDEKVSTLSVCLENKQCTITPYASNSKISTRGSSVFYYLLKHKKILYFRDPYLFIYLFTYLFIYLVIYLFILLLKLYLSFLHQIAFSLINSNYITKQNITSYIIYPYISNIRNQYLQFFWIQIINDWTLQQQKDYSISQNHENE